MTEDQTPNHCSAPYSSNCSTSVNPSSAARRIAVKGLQPAVVLAVRTRMASRVLSAAKRTSRTSCVGLPGLGATGYGSRSVTLRVVESPIGIASTPSAIWTALR